ncbi:MAG: hypothetical protein QM765_01720 [Myxococcales bacterium]
MRFADLDFELPTGWVEHPNPGGPAEYRPLADGSTGLLQVSKLPADQVAYLATLDSLGPVAVALGQGFGKAGQNWGTSAGYKEGACGLGRFGFALFQGGEFPAMLLWVTASASAGFMWTWLGPNPGASEVMQALGIVLGARLAPKG